jgi:hypothetical protein
MEITGCFLNHWLVWKVTGCYGQSMEAMKSLVAEESQKFLWVTPVAMSKFNVFPGSH